MKKYTKEQRDVQRQPHASGDNWFYVSGGRCSFHSAKHNGEGVYVHWRTLKSALRKAGLLEEAP